MLLLVSDLIAFFMLGQIKSGLCFFSLKEGTDFFPYLVMLLHLSIIHW